MSIFFLHGWVKLLPLGHSINHLESKDQSPSEDPHFTSGAGAVVSNSVACLWIPVP